MTIIIDPTIDSNYVHEVCISYEYTSTDTFGKKKIKQEHKIDFRTTINLHQKEVSINRGIRKYKLENVSKVTITNIQKLSEVNYIV